MTVALIGLAPDAGAHATLQESQPANGEILETGAKEVFLRFDEPVAVFGTGIRVFGPSGERVDRGRADVDGGELRVPIDGSTRGTYTVSWRVLSEDSHNLSGSFLFHVGVQTGAVSVADTSLAVPNAVGGVGRLLAFAGTSLVVGALAVSALASGETAATTRLLRVAAIGAVGGTAGTLLVLVAQAAQATGRPLLSAVGSVWDLAFHTRTGRFTALRAGFLGSTALLLALPPVWRNVRWLPGVTAVGAMFSVAVGGHAWTSSARGLALPADVAHQILVAGWLGGVAALVVAVRLSEDRERLVNRFSAVAMACAIGVAATGTVSGYLNVRSVNALTSTGYGQLLIAKVVGFAVLIGFGYLNRHRYLPAINRALNPLVRSLRRETAVALVVLALTAGLVNQPPAATTATKPFETTIVVPGASLTMTVDPARVGLNDMHLYFFDEAGTGAFPVDAVEISVATGDIPARKVQVTPVTSTHQSAYGVSFTSPGTWTVEIRALSAGALTTFTTQWTIR